MREKFRNTAEEISSEIERTERGRGPRDLFEIGRSEIAFDEREVG